MNKVFLNIIVSQIVSLFSDSLAHKKNQSFPDSPTITNYPITNTETCCNHNDGGRLV